MLRLMPYVFSPAKLPEIPIYLVHFITSKCNAKCPHCFVYDENGEVATGSGADLSLEEIVRFVRQIDTPLYNVNLTGGEPFSRQDILEICVAYLKYTTVQSIQLLTNGWYTDRIVNLMEYLCREYPSCNFVICISIDNLHEKHDMYRQLRGGFERAINTYTRLKNLKSKNLNLDIGITVNHYNQENLEEIYDYLVHEIKVDTLSCAITRGTVKDPKSKDVNFEKYKYFCKKIDGGIKNGELNCFRKFHGADLLNAKSVVMRDYAIPYIRKKGFLSKCYAGRLVGVLYSNGDVYPCELLNSPIGNVRQYDYSFKRLWSSSNAVRIRKRIWNTKCHCEHESFQTVNILFNLKYYPRIIKEYLMIKMKNVKYLLGGL